MLLKSDDQRTGIDIFSWKDEGLRDDNESTTRKTARAMETTKELSVIRLALPRRRRRPRQSHGMARKFRNWMPKHAGESCERVERQATIRQQRIELSRQCQCCFISILDKTSHPAAKNRVSISMHMLGAVDPVSRLMSVKNSQSNQHTTRSSQSLSDMEKMFPSLSPSRKFIGLSDGCLRTAKPKTQNIDMALVGDRHGHVSERVNDFAKTPCDLVKLYSGCSEPEC